MKRFLLILLMTAILVGSISVAVPFMTPLIANASDTHGYVSSGLVSLYDGIDNTRAGHNSTSRVWEDLVGQNDLSVAVNQKNAFTPTGYQVEGTTSRFPQKIVDLVNGDEFTVEMFFGEFVSIGSSFNTFMNSSNDNFAMFRRNANDILEFKHSGCAADKRPIVHGGLAKLQNGVISITFKKNGDVKIYVNGQEAASAKSVGGMNADDLFIGHSDGAKSFRTIYRSIRFYDRVLSSDEIKANYQNDMAHANDQATEDVTTPEVVAPGELSAEASKYVSQYVTKGLTSFFSGKFNTRSGHNKDSKVWEDLIGESALSVVLNDKNMFTDDAYHLDSVQNYFDNYVVDTVNGKEFTVELLFGDFKSLGSTYNTVMNSSNDNFALFRRLSSDEIEFKYAANAIGTRPVYGNALEELPGSLITITYRVGGKCTLYVNGAKVDSRTCSNAMGASDLYFGHADAAKNFAADYKAMRFYNRELTADEVRANAEVEGVYDESEHQNPAYVTVAQPVTNVVGDIAAVRCVESIDELNTVMSSKTLPSTVIVNINKSLEIIDKDGKAFTTVAGIIEKLNYKVMAAFNVSDEASAKAIAEYCTNVKFNDCFVMSADPNLVDTARKTNSKLRGIIDYSAAYAGKTELTKEDCLNIRKSVHKFNGTVALLPYEVCSHDTVQYLYDSIVSVWVKMSDNPNDVELYRGILSGAMGLVTDATDKMLDIACNSITKNTITRLPLNIGHRGIPSKAPENTIEGAIAAYELGANVIECDVYLTKDNEVVIMHDGTSGRTCDKDLSIEGSTLAQLKELFVNKGFERNEKYKSCKIPTLKEMLEAFKGKDCRLFIEIKSSKANIVPLIKEMIEELDMYDQCSVITFSGPQMANMRKYYPEMTIGALCSGYLDESDSDADMRSVMSFIGQYNATLNPSYAGYGKNAARAALIRGITVYPWTFVDNGGYAKFFNYGYSGLTGNNANYMQKYITGLNISGIENGAEMDAGAAPTVAVNAVKYDRSTADVTSNVKYKAIEGSDIVSISDNRITFTGKTGTVTLVAEYTYKLTGTVYSSIASQPVTFSVKQAEETEITTVEEQTMVEDETTLVESPTTATVETSGEEQSAENVTGSENTTQVEEKSEGCGSVLGFGILLLVIPVAALVRKKEN